MGPWNSKASPSRHIFVWHARSVVCSKRIVLAPPSSTSRIQNRPCLNSLTSGTYPRIAFDADPTRPCPTLLSASHSGAGEVTRPESSGPADRSVHRVSRRPPDPARSCLDWPSRPCRVADCAWQRNTPPGGLVGADVNGRIADCQWSVPLRRQQVRPERFGRSDVGLCFLQQRFEFSDGSCCCYTLLHRSPCRGSEVHDVAMYLQSTSTALGRSAIIVGSVSLPRACESSRDGLPRMVVEPASLPRARDNCAGQLWFG
jgi:hypothetical protein